MAVYLLLAVYFYLRRLWATSFSDSLKQTKRGCSLCLGKKSMTQKLSIVRCWCMRIHFFNRMPFTWVFSNTPMRLSNDDTES
jgi:hypothetical protein